MLCKPYKKCKPSHLSQAFGVNPQPYQKNGHVGVDWSFPNAYGTFLLAPEDLVVEKLVKAESISDDTAPMRRGYGIVMRSISRPQRKHLYWHNLPVFPCKVGDVIKQGEEVAQMGNSGFVMQGGVKVPLEDRSKPPYPGTHLHQEIIVNGRYVDPLPLIDWKIKVSGVELNVIQRIINSIKRLLKNVKQN